MTIRMKEDMDANDLAEIYIQVVDQLKTEIKTKGIRIPDKPVYSGTVVDVSDEGEPIIPYDLTACSLKTIGQLFSVCHSWLAYIGPLVAIASIEMKVWEEVRDFIWSRLRQEEEGTKSDKDDKVRNSPRYIRVNAKYLLYSTQYDIIKGKCKQYENMVSALSREITRRQSELELHKMEGGIGKRASGLIARGTAEPNGAVLPDFK
jgi:hypothetical protein